MNEKQPQLNEKQPQCIRIVCNGNGEVYPIGVAPERQDFGNLTRGKDVSPYHPGHWRGRGRITDALSYQGYLKITGIRGPGRYSRSDRCFRVYEAKESAVTDVMNTLREAMTNISMQKKPDWRSGKRRRRNHNTAIYKTYR